MTIRFITAWNGYRADQVVSGLGGAEETRLIGLGFAVADLDGPDNTPLPVVATTNLTGVSRLSAGDVDVTHAGVLMANTITLMGDSLAANNWTGVTSNYANVAPFPFTMANAIGRNRFKVLANIAVAGSSTPSHVTTQLPLLQAAPTKYVYYMGGTNDIFIDAIAGDVVAARVIAILEDIMAAGCIPIWSTLWARPTQTAAKDAALLRCNAILRSYAKNSNVGIFYDGFYISQLPGSATLNPRSGWRYDGAGSAFIHPGTLEGYWQGKYINKACDAAGVPQGSGFSYGPEDFTTTAAYGKANLLVNPSFATSSAAGLGSNCTGVTPVGWSIAWGTRAGSGVAGCSIVDVNDPDTGLPCAKGLAISISGTPTANDYLRVQQTSGFANSIGAGQIYSAQMVADIPAAGNCLVYMRGQTNEGQTWWGTPLATTGAGANGMIPEAARLYMETLGLTQVNTSSQGIHDTWIVFGGASSGNIVLSQPRFRASDTANY